MWGGMSLTFLGMLSQTPARTRAVPPHHLLPKLLPSHYSCFLRPTGSQGWAWPEEGGDLGLAYFGSSGWRMTSLAASRGQAWREG